MSLLFIYWNPSRIFFTMPFVNIPITFYGCLFATGFILSANLFFFILKKNFENNNIQILPHELNKFFDRLCLYGALSIVVGSRIGHVLFYDLPFYLKNPLKILKIWEGGLSSYGGVIAIFIFLFAIVSFYKKKLLPISFFLLTDIMAIVFGFFASMVRLGNFFNQEIIGIKTRMPWGVYFANNYSCIINGPVHPVQIYESFFYLLVFICLFTYWKRKKISLGKGFFTAVTCIVLPLGRFILEFYKENTSLLLPGHFLLTMGQILSLPFLLFGLTLLFKRIKI